jgi:hypothetical protein
LVDLQNTIRFSSGGIFSDNKRNLLIGISANIASKKMKLLSHLPFLVLFAPIETLD